MFIINNPYRQTLKSTEVYDTYRNMQIVLKDEREDIGDHTAEMGEFTTMGRSPEAIQVYNDNKMRRFYLVT